MLPLNANLHPLMSRMHKVKFESQPRMQLPIQLAVAGAIGGTSL